MSTIAQQIEEILDKRLGRGLYAGRGRLQVIEARIANLASVKKRIEELDALVATIKNQIVEINGKFFSPFFIVIKQIAHFNIFEMLIMGGNFLPCPGFADQFCHFLPTPYLRPRFRLL